MFSLTVFDKHFCFSIASKQRGSCKGLLKDGEAYAYLLNVLVPEHGSPNILDVKDPVIRADLELDKSKFLYLLHKYSTKVQTAQQMHETLIIHAAKGLLTVVARVQETVFVLE
ncbi:hypothetical protein CTI12_AA100740 [Artemisia annua]|uniref:Uncharacterized protein n=1 Tax=Artemisia annua TaxID=35608 RepID=A0A2U1PXN1_ARTAN|nr:hypothetical protein CTI12_AA100740 [Artemisia annua]